MRTGRSRAIVVAATVVGVAGIAWIAVDQAVAYAAYRRLDDLCVGGTASPEALRVSAEKALGWRFGDPHLAFQVLLVHGNQSSIPYLRAALARKPSGDSVTCAWGHGEEALERLCAAQGSRSEAK